MTLQQILEAARALPEPERRRLVEQLVQESRHQRATALEVSLVGLWQRDDVVVEQMVEELLTERETRRLRA